MAGARIVIDGGRWEQDQVAKRIMEAFADCPKAPDLIDRRAKPSYGYRAVHVVAYEDGTPVEIQIRTKLQDTWAQITEKLGDAWGRGLRYGAGPEQPDLPVVFQDPEDATSGDEIVTRGKLMDVVAELAKAIDTVENAQFQIDKLAAPLDGYRQRMQALTERLLGGVSNLGGAK